ncbi:MAG: flagellar biosynthesis anti-sigma factor FlgM [Bacteriovoracaceae bacterium]|jgi:negative regulator of flagellin synthesis FlgM|nr:flagellar biosynthesis anti-sigma factor FlgM [Bacteriovoracaceae bacterium]
MSKIDPNINRSSFFPKGKNNGVNKANGPSKIPRNGVQRAKELAGITSKDAKVDIPEAIKDFAKIKKVVDKVPTKDNTAKIAKLKAQISQGTYSINYDKLADKMLDQEYI